MNMSLSPGKSNGLRSMDPLGRGMCEGWSPEVGRRFAARRFVETVAVTRQPGSHRSFQLRSVNFLSAKLRCTELKN
jgi:hypothetical protein